jgi:hypothetical protein
VNGSSGRGLKGGVMERVERETETRTKRDGGVNRWAEIVGQRKVVLEELLTSLVKNDEALQWAEAMLGFTGAWKREYAAAQAGEPMMIDEEALAALRETDEAVAAVWALRKATFKTRKSLSIILCEL